MPRKQKRPDAATAHAALLRALEHAPGGLTRAEAQRTAGLSTVSPSTALRWLNQLVDRGLVRVEGDPRTRRYVAGSRPAESTDAAAITEGIPVSPAGERVRELVNRPLMERRPTSYVRAFLDQYRPNETFYLPAITRRHLLNLGRTTATPQPGGTYARQILQRLLIDLSWNSSRLEGNTYSLLDTERLLVDETAAAGKNRAERQMILNHKAAIEWLVEEAGAESLPLRSSLLRNLHALLMQNLVGDPADEGRVRARPVQIGGSTFIPLAVPQQIEECLTQVALTADAIADPFEQAFFLLVHVPYLQPFVDGNKRTARLAANVPFIRANLRPLTFVDVPERAFVAAILGVYELRQVELLRDVFTWTYERSCARYAAVHASLGEPDPFRLAHRALLKETVAALVRAGHGADDLEEVIQPFAVRVDPGERPRFRAVVEAELRGLHDGNFARFGLRPSEFEVWRRHQAERAEARPDRGNP
jgi:Fic family protein